MADAGNLRTKMPERKQKAKSADPGSRLSAALTSMLKTILWVTSLSFLVCESVYLLLLYIGSLDFPGILVCCLVPIIVGTAIVDKFFSDDTTALTLLSSAIGSIAVVDFIFGKSPSPVFFFFSASFVGDIVIMVIITSVVYSIARSLYGLLSKRQISQRYYALIIVAVSGLGTVALIYVYQSFIIEFFDQHPWLATILAIVVSSVVAYAIGRRKERK